MPGKYIIHRWTLAIILVAASSLVSYFGPGAWGHYLYTRKVRGLQQACLNYSAPTDMIVYDTDPADRAKLLDLGPPYRAFNDWAVFHVPEVWHDFRGSYDCPDGTAFVHARTSPAGHRRLVAVDIIPLRQEAIGLRGSAVDLAPRFDLKKLESCRRSMGKAENEWTAEPQKFIRIFAGQIDPADASRFEIPADFGNGRVLIQGQLRDDDTVALGSG